MWYLVEPHADDVFLSLHAHITGPWKSRPLTIVTVYAEPDRKKEAEEYASSVGCHHVCLSLPEVGGITNQTERYCPPWEEWGSYGMPEVRRGDVLVFPVGLQHPDHLALAGIVPDIVGCTIWRYLDCPYYAKLKLREEVATKCSSLTVLSLMWARKDKWKKVQIFKSQGKYFYYNPPESLPLMELVLR